MQVVISHVMLEHRNNLDLWAEALHQQQSGHSEIREAFITVLSTTTIPMKAEEIHEAVQEIRPETGRATIYRLIDKLTNVGLLRRVHGYRNCSTYIPSLGVDQPLLLCTDCGQVSYLSPSLCEAVMRTVETVKRELEDRHITGYQLQLFEVCIACQTDKS